MIDEFQDTNAVQLGDPARRSSATTCSRSATSSSRSTASGTPTWASSATERALSGVRCGGCAVNFRSPRGAAGRAQRGVRARARASGSRRCGPGARSRRWTTTARCGCSASDPPRAQPPVELLITDTQGWDELAPRLGLAQGGDQPWRRAEARLIAAPAAPARSTTAAAPGDIVVLVRATSRLRLLEEALEEQGLPTYVVGGRGYWSQEQVRDGLAWLRVLANPHDEEALLTVLVVARSTARAPTSWSCSPQDGRARGSLWAARPGPRRARSRRLLAAEREHAERAPLEVLLERAIVATGYDLADAGAARRRPPAGEPAQADAPGGRVRARRGPRPARLPRRRRRPATWPRRARARRRSSPRAWTPCG